MDITHTIALTMGLAWASGINLYAALFMLGYLGATGNMDLPPDLQILSNPLVLFAAGFMYCVEFFADKAPGVDSAWDAVHTFIRIPAGAILAAGAVGDVSQAAQLAAGILGGTLAAGTHTLKAGTRVLINTSPEPFSNWTASVAEDAMVIGGLWLALQHPVLYIALLVLFIIMMIWILPKLWRAIKRVGGYLARLFKRRDSVPKPDDTPPSRLPPQSQP